jgi:2,4-dienoyl-CoA reductase-like NADH-dependent reductase (Old Yellow Enzyme family)
MYEHGAAFGGGPPTAFHDALYRKWAQGGWAMIFTGNVQVCKRHLTLGRDLVVPPDLSPVNVAPFKRLADVMHDGGRQEDIPLAIMQLSHSGRQSANFLGGRWPFQPPDAPSAIPVGANAGSGWLERTVYALTFATPRPLDAAGIDGVVEAFLRGAKLAHAAGYDGVELHASHGCTSFPCSKYDNVFRLAIDLLASFISPKARRL